jgi:hypothetical protein
VQSPVDRSAAGVRVPAQQPHSDDPTGFVSRAQLNHLNRLLRDDAEMAGPVSAGSKHSDHDRPDAFGRRWVNAKQNHPTSAGLLDSELTKIFIKSEENTFFTDGLAQNFDILAAWTIRSHPSHIVPL